MNKLFPLIVFIISFAVLGSAHAQEALNPDTNSSQMAVLEPTTIIDIENKEIDKEDAGSLTQVSPIIEETGQEEVQISEELTPVEENEIIAEVVLNEVMANAPTPETDYEWIELYNNSSFTADLNGWKLDGKIISDPLAIIPAGGYLILARNPSAFKLKWPEAPSIPVIPISMTLTNAGDLINLESPNESYSQKFSWAKDSGDNISWERLDPANESSMWYNSLGEYGSTPGIRNSIFGIKKPSAPVLISPEDQEELVGVNSIKLVWDSTDPNSFFNILVSTDSELENLIVEETGIKEKEFLVEDLSPGIYYWQVIATNSLFETASPIYSFEITQPDYSDAIMINEIMPDPAGDEATGEWFELYNSSDESVDLKDWIIEDIAGKTKEYVIPKSLVIGPKDYLVFYRSETGITLNNDEDGLYLYQPDKILLDETPVFSDGETGWAYILKPNGKWDWSTKPTPSKKNVISYPPVEDDELEIGGSEDNSVINNIPVEVKTGDYENYENKLVKIQGKVISTSGNTFYLDDGTGSAKVYIQEKTGIDKPPMHKGDVFIIVGIVNLYRNTWRILPQKQEDIKAIGSEVIAEDEDTAPVKNTTVSKTSAKAVTTENKARAPTIVDIKSPISPSVASAQTNSGLGQPDFKITPWWTQLLKLITGLAVVFLLLLIFRVKSYAPVKIIGGNFGEDET